MRARGPAAAPAAAPRQAAPGSAPGAPAPSLPSRPSCIGWPFRHLPYPAAKPPLPPLSLHPSGGCGAPTRRGWREGCRCRGTPRRPGGSDPPASASPHALLRPPRPSAPLPSRAQTPAARPAPSPCEPAAALRAGGRAEARAGAGAGGGGAGRRAGSPEPGPALSSARLAAGALVASGAPWTGYPVGRWGPPAFCCWRPAGWGRRPGVHPRPRRRPLRRRRPRRLELPAARRTPARRAAASGGRRSWAGWTATSWRQ